MVDFDIAPVKSSIIMCAGIGGGGGNAVKHMYNLGMAEVTFMICNTDRQALEDSPIPIKIRLGEKLTGGFGAGNQPERGREAAEESIEEIKATFVENETRMLFITAGMGGGTGTGAAPVIAKAAKEAGILTVAIVSIPFKTEGHKRIQQAIKGIEEISKYVDSLLVIDNESINEIHGDLTLSDAFGKADDILATAAKSIADIITSHFHINVDFEDVKTIMQNSGVALMGSAQGSGENRALEVAAKAMSSPLLNHKDISGAQNVLLNITSGEREVTLRETYEITQYIQDKAGNNHTTDLIWGAGQDKSLGEDVRVTVIATGFGMDSIPALKERYRSSLRCDNDSDTAKSTRETIDLNEPNKKTEKVIPANDDDFAVVIKETTSTRSEPPRQAEPSVISVNIPSRNRRSTQPDNTSIDTPSQTTTPQATGVTSESTTTSHPETHSQEPETAYPTQNNAMKDGDPLTQDMSDDALNIPAWKRRGVQLDPILSSPSGGKVKRETLRTEAREEEANTLDLFDSE